MALFSQIKVPRGLEYYWSKILTNENGKTWYIHTSGAVAIKYKNGKERQLHPFLRREKLYVKVNNKDTLVKCLVAAAVSNQYAKGIPVIHKDRNPANCDYRNLILISKKTLGQRTGHLSTSKKVLVTYPDGRRKIYRSVRECAKALYCSYQTVLDYFSGRSRNSILSDYVIVYTKYDESDLTKLDAVANLQNTFKAILQTKFAAQDYWQKDICAKWDGYCVAGETDCDSCTSFERLKPQSCVRCGSEFYEHKQNTICAKCRTQRIRQYRRKYAVLKSREGYRQSIN